MLSREIQKVHNFTLPEWANSTVMAKMGELRGISFSVSSGTTELKRLYGGPLLKRLMTNMRESSTKSKRKMFVHSAHDDTLGAVMSSMGIFNSRIPPYASSLIVELHEEENTGKYFVEVNYS